MINNPILQQRIDEAATTDEQFLIDYNAETVVVEVHDVPMGKVDLHMKKALYFKLRAAERDPELPDVVHDVASAAIQLPAAPHIPTLDVWSDDFKQNLDVLVYFGVFDQTDVQGLLALGTRYTSKSLIDHGQATTQQDIDIMRAQPSITALEAIENRLRAAFNAALLNTQTARFALERGEEATVYSAEQVKDGFIAVFDNGEAGEI